MGLKQKLKPIKILMVSINPALLFYITYTIILGYYIVPYYIHSQWLRLGIGIFFFIISILFFNNLISFLFTPNNLLTIKIQTIMEKPEDGLHFLKNEAEKWLNVVSKFIENAESRSSTDCLKNNKEIREEIQEIRLKGSNLQHIFNRVSSESIHADREAIEELIGFRCDSDPKIVEELINDYNSIEKDTYLFSWDKIPGSHDEILKAFLKQKFHIDWVKTAEINKIDNDKAITLSSNNNLISLTLNDEKTKVQLRTSDGRADEFITKKEKGVLNIYKDSNIKLKIRIAARKERLSEIRNQLGKLKEYENFIPDIIDIIRDTSTRRAVVKSANVLQKAKVVDDLKWLITFINSRIGFDMAELLGLKVEGEYVKWNDKEGNDKKVVNISGFKDYMNLFKLDIDKASFLYTNYGTISKINDAKIHEVEEVRKIAKDMVDLDDVKMFSSNFKKKGDDALNNLWLNFYGWHWNELTRHFISGATPRLAIALTSGYSNTLAFILDKILEKAKVSYDIKNIQLLLIKSDSEFGSDQKFGDVELLKAELIGKHPGLNCRIMPIDIIKMHGLQIGKVFIGIESIDITGDIVHPRGNMKVIENIRDCAPTASFYAFGETYKVKDFKKIPIDYTKLAFLNHDKINYVVTDHGIHKRDNILDKWEVLFGPYLFSWEKIPGSDNERLKTFLKQNFGVDWVNTAEIKKVDDDKAIELSSNNNSISLKRNNDKTKVQLKISDGRNDEFKMGNDMLYIDPNKYKWNQKTTNLDCCIVHWKNQ